MKTKRNVSPNKKKAVKIAWKGKCAITGLDPDEYPDLGLELNIDHVKPLDLGGSNDFDNLVPMLAHMNLLKSNRRLPKEFENMLHFLAAGKKVKAQIAFERLSHKKLTFKISCDMTVEQIDKAVMFGKSQKYSAEDLRFLLVEWCESGICNLDDVAAELGKSRASLIAKLGNMGIYDPTFEGRA